MSCSGERTRGPRFCSCKYAAAIGRRHEKNGPSPEKRTSSSVRTSPRPFSPPQKISRTAPAVREYAKPIENRRAAKFDITKCTWVNQQHISSLTSEDFVARALPFCIEAGLPQDSPILKPAIATVQHKVKTLLDVPAFISFFFNLVMDEETLAKLQPGAGALMAVLADTLEGLSQWDGHEIVYIINSRA